MQLYAPVQGPRLDVERGNESEKMYGAYLRHYGPNVVMAYNFLGWCRRYRMVDGTARRRPDDPVEGVLGGRRLAVGVDFCFELLDRFMCQFFVMFFPHRRVDEFIVAEGEELGYMKYFVGGLKYLHGLRWFYDTKSHRTLVRGEEGALYAPEAFAEPLPGIDAVDMDVHDEFVFAVNVNGTSGVRTSVMGYLQECLMRELSIRVSKKRVATCLQRIIALGLLYDDIERSPAERARKVREWNASTRRELVPRVWSAKQQLVLDLIKEGTEITDANELAKADRMLAIAGEPGSGKSEVLVHAAVRAMEAGLCVLILCPTGSLVHSYRDRLPETDRLAVETVHSGFRISRRADEAAVRYAPPSRLRRYDLFLLDEASQLEDAVAGRLLQGVAELPQRPFFVMAADFQQLNPVQSGRGLMRRVYDAVRKETMDSIHRTKDGALLVFCKRVRLEQPDRQEIEDFFLGRHWTHDLEWCVREGLIMGREQGCIFAWLCVTNAGAEKVNAAALKVLGITPAAVADGYPCDPKIKGSNIVLVPGLQVRLTRNLDKDRGFVNGALGTVHEVLSRHTFILRLSSGGLVLVHPVSGDGDERLFLPCVYGYATTIRRAQGATLKLGCLYFDHSHPPERGYGYVGVSRFESQAGVYHFGRIRRTDWLPVGGSGDPREQVHRGDDSQSSCSGSDGGSSEGAVGDGRGLDPALEACRSFNDAVDAVSSDGGESEDGCAVFDGASELSREEDMSEVDSDDGCSEASSILSGSSVHDGIALVDDGPCLDCAALVRTLTMQQEGFPE